jgi:hypothetical protein
MSSLSNADVIKACLVDMLIKNHGRNILLGTEVAYGTQRRFSDLIMINEDKVTGFEIKASNDDLRDIELQMESYRSIFDYFYIALTTNHYNSVRSLLKDTDGIILINGNLEPLILKKARIIYQKSKSEIIGTLTIKFIKDYFDVSPKMTSKVLRGMIEKKSMKVIQQALNAFYEQKLTPRNILFKSELGCVTHYEDLALLSFSYGGVLLSNEFTSSSD